MRFFFPFPLVSSSHSILRCGTHSSPFVVHSGNSILNTAGAVTVLSLGLSNSRWFSAFIGLVWRQKRAFVSHGLFEIRKWGEWSRHTYRRSGGSRFWSWLRRSSCKVTRRDPDTYVSVRCTSITKTLDIMPGLAWHLQIISWCNPKIIAGVHVAGRRLGTVSFDWRAQMGAAVNFSYSLIWSSIFVLFAQLGPCLVPKFFAKSTL